MSRLLQFTRTLISTNKVSSNRNILTARNTDKFIKTCSTKSQETFTTIYKFPYIRHIAISLVLKKYVIIGTIAATTICGALEVSGVTPQYLAISFLVFGCLITITMIPFSFLLKNTIGFLSVTPNLKKIKISHVDVWGKRVDKIVPTNDLIPLSDLPVLRTDRFFLVPRLYSENITFRYFQADNFILDKEKLNFVLGVSNPSHYKEKKLF